MVVAGAEAATVGNTQAPWLTQRPGCKTAGAATAGAGAAGACAEGVEAGTAGCAFAAGGGAARQSPRRHTSPAPQSASSLQTINCSLAMGTAAGPGFGTVAFGAGGVAGCGSTHLPLLHTRSPLQSVSAVHWLAAIRTG